MLPALANSSEALARNAQEAALNAKAQAGNLVKQKEGLKVYNQLVDKIEEGTDTVADYRSGLNSLDGSLATEKKRLAAVNNEQDRASGAYARVQGDINRVKAARLDLIRVMAAQGVADAKERAALGILQLQQGSLILSFRSLTGAVADYSRALALSNVNGSASIAVLNGIKVAAFGTATGLRALASGFFALLGPLGLLLSFGPLIFDFFKNKFFPDNTNEKAIELIENMEVITKTLALYSRAIVDGTVNTEKFASAISGSIQTASDTVREAFAEDVRAAQERRDKILELEKEIQLRRSLGEKEGTKKNAPRSVSRRTELGRLVDELAELESASVAYSDKFKTTIEVAEGAVKRLVASGEKGVTLISPFQAGLLESALEQLKSGDMKPEEFFNALTRAQAPAQNLTTAFENLTSSGENF
jgi:DNA repair exonuclease SbcCD ATPase subunit